MSRHAGPITRGAVTDAIMNESSTIRIQLNSRCIGHRWRGRKLPRLRIGKIPRAYAHGQHDFAHGAE
jgi:hypothetical protein